ncbi:MAG: twin-arginine translocase subunit TatC, partial [Alphaproteobacteria bacterium]|nr:twin-arginine translocase subunit TatC [Alphaproteobacteria bacterium]
MKKMTLMQHFSEMRSRILWCVLIFCLSFVFGWYISPLLQNCLTQPLLSVWPDGALLYTGLTDGLMIRLSLSALFAMIVLMPVLLWHIWAFVSPGLRKTERNFIWPILILSPILFLMGASFAFYFLFPIAFKFFVELNQTTD